MNGEALAQAMIVNVALAAPRSAAVSVSRGRLALPSRAAVSRCRLELMLVSPFGVRCVGTSMALIGRTRFRPKSLI
jgi:hypothetical protein